MKEKIYKIFDSKIFKKILLVFFAIQPLLDIYYLYIVEGINEIFKFSPATIIRMTFIFILIIYTLVNLKKLINHKKNLIIYLVLFTLYIIFHLYSAFQFDNTNLGEDYFSLFGEIFYFIRMLIPLFMILLTYSLDIKFKDISNIAFFSSYIISIVMIITNILYLAIPSYDGVTMIQGNFFSWFNGAGGIYSYRELASKGIFHMANQISGTLILLLPIMFCEYLKRPNKIKFIGIMFHTISMFMLGTRVGSYGVLILIFLSLIIYITISIIQKEKIRKKNVVSILLILIISLFIFKNAPIQGREFTTKLTEEETQILNKLEETKDEKINNVINENDSENDNQESNNDNNKVDNEDITNYILNNSKYYLIRWIYPYEIYPASLHQKFWLDVFELPEYQRNTTRKIQLLILKDVKKNNKLISDLLYGMTFTRLRNAKLYLEQDIITHYYSIGILGIIFLLGPYFYCLLKGVIKALIKFEKYMTLENVFLILSIGICICSGVASGNVLDELIVIIYLGMVCGHLLKRVRENKNIPIEAQKKVSVIIPVYNTEKYLEKCLDSVVKQTYENIEIIVINDGSPDNSQEIVNRFQKNYPKLIKSFEKENGGLSDARNFGLTKATGDYIAFLDSDDYVEHSCYEKLINKAVENDFDIVVCDFYNIYDNKKNVGYSNVIFDIKEKSDIKKVFKNIYPVAWNKLYKKDLFKNVKFKKGIWYEDVEFLYRLLPEVNSIGVIQEPLINYVHRDGAITKTFDQRLYNYIDNWNGLLKYYTKNNILHEYKKEFEYSYVRYLYATFLKQATNYNDYEEYKKAVKIAIENVKKHFPKYKQNRLFYTSLKGIYLVLFNQFLAKLLYKRYHKNNKMKKVMFISSTGGHFHEMSQMKPLLKKYDYYIVTEKTSDKMYLRDKYPKKVSYLMYGTKDYMLTYPFKLLFNCFKSLFLYIKVRPDVIITTGAHTAGPMCCIGKIFGSKIIFIESMANITTKTITGRLIYKFADLFIVQWESMLSLYPNAKYGGWIF